MKKVLKPSVIIHINGLPGVGKLTVAKALAKKRNAHLIDNHLIINTAVAISERRSDDYQKIILGISEVLLNHVKNTPNQIFIFTNALVAELEEDCARVDQIRNFANQNNLKYLQVYLHCDLATNKSRIVETERTSKGKIVNADILDDIQRLTIYHPETENMLDIDTTDLTAEQTADKIVSKTYELEHKD